ncbi:MAG TPA: CRISPR system precrRNA processing endoribonuclease RAMP protein Cas6 [Syntrophomonadaceae bacterium]|nr:CRISPR system precrRNA processing endoribonuclease RAMP protein Cas6 [Syntrophomonadaceae bacterium]HOQ10580.1 CRISPR system precrRNA processing endoribonuclease RAMP protein Cas6 [Syntrophomonadaceae bacterium]HPU49694.1 CRISPR system precrRNA processing endoribonuclease RAMP protein Cas6 [Syntrophomonadaceae bacterium]HQA08373.1 CRISPR system precrRNA processing endoribonuclease RAMP protein Cas6 [Syntrophomonadaceae bacterium]HQE24043.1 CRISPR system precrRNA processing endoribonuclease R
MRLCRLELLFSSEQNHRLAPFLGSTIRGAFGNILKELHCTKEHGKCSICEIRNRCIYTYIFESGWYFAAGEKIQSGVPQPYVLEPQVILNRETGRSQFKLGMVLFGNSIQHLSAILACLQIVGLKGLGKYRTPFILEEIKDNFSGQILWKKGMDQLISSPRVKTWQDYQEQALQLGTVNRCQIHIVTPLRVKTEGHLSNELKFSTIFKAVVRRASLLNKYYGNGKKEDVTELINLSSQIPSGTLNLHWQEMERYSRRQDQRMLLGGLVGIMECEGELTPFLPWLLLGQDIHIGKNTTFGLGGYELKVL